MFISELDSLQKTLNSSIDAIRSELKAAGYPELSTYSHEPHPLDLEGALPTPQLYQAQMTAIAALGRLDVLIQNPFRRVSQQIYAVHESASLVAVVKLGLVELLTESKERLQGMHIMDIQQELDVDARKLTPILRLLCSRGWFYEVRQDVYSLTRPSLQLKKGCNAWKSIQTPGKPVVADKIYEYLTHPQWRYSQDPSETAYQLAFGTDKNVFDHVYGQPETALAFAESVVALGDEFSPGLVEDFPWKKLDGRRVVDCGGGTGSLTALLLPRMPRSTFVVQDLNGPLQLAKCKLSTAFPVAWKRGQVKLEEHDFFTAQPQKGRNCLYLLRWILHDWPDREAIQILQNIAQAGGKGAKVLIAEFVIIPGVVSKVSTPKRFNSRTCGLQAPPFIPADFGEALNIIHAMSVHMMAAFNAKERTLADYEGLLHAAGIKIVGLHRGRSPLAIIEAEVI